MKEEIIKNSQDPLKMEELYRNDPSQFKSSFADAYSAIEDKAIAQFWNIRLNFESIAGTGALALSPEFAEEKENKNFSLIFTVIASLLAGTFVKIPEMLGYTSEQHVVDNLAFFVLPLLCIYYMIKNKADIKNATVVSFFVLSGLLFMNLVPWQVKSDTRLLSSLHMVFIMWALLGAAYMGFSFSARDKQMQFLRRNGDVIVLTGIIIICGMFLTALTAGLFQAIGIKLPEFVFENIAKYGVSASPIVANYMVESSPKIINKVTPFISKIFTPLILILMTVFIVALTFFSKDPFNNRQELIVFNVLLAVNMAVIVFSFSGNSPANSFQNKVLLFLSAEALIINLVALSAIVYRLFAFGITPNRLAVLGANVLMFINLIIIALKLFGYLRSKTDTQAVHRSMTMILPWYTAWAVIAAFVFPLVFWFK
jgi:hypothetical protein